LDPTVCLGIVVILSTQYASYESIEEVTFESSRLLEMLAGRKINAVICDNGVSTNSISADAKNLTELARKWQKVGYRVVVVGYSRGGNVALYAQTVQGMNASGVVTIESPIRGAQPWVLRCLGFNMAYQGVVDMQKGSESNNELLEAIGDGTGLPPMREISGLVGRTVAGPRGLDIFSPVTNQTALTWSLVHGGKGWNNPFVVEQIVDFVNSLEK
jgi:hypothetical protein